MGFTFNGIHSDTFGIIVAKKKDSLLAAERNYLSEIIGKHGVYDFGLDFNARRIEFECYLNETSYELLQSKAREVADWLNPLVGCKNLVLDYDGGRIYSARLENAGEIDELASLGKCNLSFLCPSPFSRSSTISEVNFISGVATIARAGSAPAPCVISVTLTASSSYLTFTHSGGKFIKVTHAFVLNNTLEIDTEKRTVKINGVNSLTKLDVESTFFELNKGTETVTVTPTNVITGKVSFYERWL